MEEGEAISIAKKFTGISQEGVISMYDEIAKNYEQFNDFLSIPDPYITGDYIADLGLEKEVKILEFGCGTGRLGERLAKNGYSNVTGIDASKGMLEEAEGKKAYVELRQVRCCTGELPEDLKKGFTVVTHVGFLLSGHVTPDVIDENVECLEKKTGSAIIFAVRDDYYESLGFKARVDKYIEEGVLKQVY